MTGEPEKPMAAEGRKDDEEEAQARTDEMKKSLETKRALRKSNLAPERPDTGFFRSLDSSIKRNTAVIKKLKLINEEQREGLMEELKSVNLSKFVTEAVNAICEAKLRSSDINAAVQVCSLLHQRYRDFSSNLVQGLLKAFIPSKGVDEVDGSFRAMRKRSSLKLLMEMYFCGITEDTAVFVTILKDLTATEHLRDREAAQTNLSLLAAFARQGRFFLGLPLGNYEAELYKDITMSSDHRRQLKKMVQGFYDAAVDVLHSEHTTLRNMEQENARMLNAKGELSEEHANAYEKLRKSYDHLFRNISSLADALDIQPPAMPEDTNTTRVAVSDGAAVTPTKGSAAPEPIWDDDDTKSFYESLPDLRAFVPAVLLGESESKSTDQSQSKVQEQADTETNAAESNSPADHEADEKPSPSEKAKDKDKDDDSRKDHDKEKWKAYGDSGSLESILQRLQSSVSRDLIDQLTVDFCYVNSKANRKKLVRTLFNVPRTSLELLPYYSRMVATLSSCMKDIAPMLLQQLEDEFNFLLNKKDQMNIETKIKNIRFLGELAKFRVASPGLMFSCLKSCLDDFTHHNIDVACNLLECCGRFLYRCPETSGRMSNMLDIIMRLKNVKNLDARHSTMVENAYYQCKPPERSARVMKAIPELHQYIKKLLFQDLDKSSIEQVLRQFRKLPWDECEHYVLKCFMKVHKLTHDQIQLVASLTAGLSRYHDAFAVAIVDEVLEEIRQGLESNEVGMHQRRIAFMRFLGELYSYRLIDSCIIFETLYLIIFFGEGTPEQDVVDPPEDFFRIRLVIKLLQTCGQFFDRGSSKKKLDRFLVFFQRYVLWKAPIPLDVEFDLQDIFAYVRPRMVRYTSFEEAHQALLEMEEREGLGNQISMDYPASAEPARSMEAGTAQAENGGDDAESDTQSSAGLDGHDEDEDDDGSEEDDDTLEHPASEEDHDHVKLKRSSKEVDPEEAAEFEKELRALLQESVDSRKFESRSRPTLNMMIPMNLLEGKEHHGRSMDVESSDDAGDEGKVTFRVLVKKGNKHQLKQLPIPRDSSLVQSTKQKEAAEYEEKQDIKRLVLEYNEREIDERGTSQPISWSAMQPSVMHHHHHHHQHAGRGAGRSGAAAAAASDGSVASGRSAISRQRRPVAAGYGGRRR